MHSRIFSSGCAWRGGRPLFDERDLGRIGCQNAGKLKKEQTVNLWVSELRGRRVTNYDFENLGRVEDLMLDSSTGNVEYAVVSFDSLAENDARLYPVPLRALTVDMEGGLITLNADREMIRHAPGFERNQWPDTGDPRWQSGVRSYYSF